jgi:lipopolysaccharide transport system ATP-binding protein
MKPILEIKNISKSYRIGRKAEAYLSLRETLTGLFSPTGRTEEFFALKNLSFDVNAGDTIGIIGKNGAGKSTLLKVLSRITPPTEGSITCRGRIASLLEVGTGFHGELTGRENIYMNGSILGMRKKEIEKNFDAIVDFSGVEKFIDTPLKHYSSGMQLRLAFAVAAFLENEILIIDEVLAVGDAEFQKKCLGKMEEVSKSGRTVLFVSHNLGAVSSFCSKSILLSHGQLLKYGTTAEIIEAYLSVENQEKTYRSEGKGKDIFFSSVEVYNNDKSANEFAHTDSIRVVMNLEVRKKTDSFKTGIAVLDRNKNKIFTHHFLLENPAIGQTVLECVIPPVLCPGKLSFDIAAFIPNLALYDYVNDVCPITILETGTDMFQDTNYGQVFVACEWKKNS